MQWSNEAWLYNLKQMKHVQYLRHNFHVKYVKHVYWRMWGIISTSCEACDAWFSIKFVANLIAAAKATVKKIFWSEISLRSEILGGLKNIWVRKKLFSDPIIFLGLEYILGQNYLLVNRLISTQNFFGYKNILDGVLTTILCYIHHTQLLQSHLHKKNGQIYFFQLFVSRSLQKNSNAVFLMWLLIQFIWCPYCYRLSFDM